MKKIIKVAALYAAITLGMVLLCSELNVLWLVIACVESFLVMWCYNHITLREVANLTGYAAWYKFLK